MSSELVDLQELMDVYRSLWQARSAFQEVYATHGPTVAKHTEYANELKGNMDQIDAMFRSPMGRLEQQFGAFALQNVGLSDDGSSPSTLSSADKGT